MEWVPVVVMGLVSLGGLYFVVRLAVQLERFESAYQALRERNRMNRQDAEDCAQKRRRRP